MRGWSAMSPDLLRYILADAETHNPELWHRCYPRIYQEPHKCGEYWSPKLLALDLYGIGLKWQNNIIGRSEQYEFQVASHLAHFKVPQFWLARDMAEAIKQTVPPVTGWDWYNAELPFEAAVIHLPKGILPHDNPEEGHGAFVGYARLRANDEKRSGLLPHTTYASTNGCMVLIANSSHGGHFYHWNLPYDAYPTLDLTALDKACHEPWDSAQHQSGWWYTPHMSYEDNSFLGRAGHLLFGALLLLDARPDLLTKASLLKRVPGKKSERPREFWSPNIIGENYKIRRVSRDLGGTHASPRAHWVRGHHKDIPYGPKHTLRKRGWIEPYFVGEES